MMAPEVEARYADAVRAVEGARFEIVDFMRFNEKSDIWNFIPHSHGFFELLFFLHGNAQISLGRRSVYATFADALIYPPRTEHTEHLQINHRQEIYCLQVRCEGLMLSEPLHLHDRRQQLRLLLDGLYAEYTSGEADAQVIESYLRTLAVMIVRNSLFGDLPAHPVDTCMMYMRRNLAEDITIQQLADLIHVSRSYLNKIFVQRTGVTPMRYMQDIRVDAAKSLLMTTHRRVADIAADVGFHSPKYFCRAFHQATGLSPMEYRQSEGLEAFAGERD